MRCSVTSYPGQGAAWSQFHTKPLMCVFFGYFGILLLSLPVSEGNVNEYDHPNSSLRSGYHALTAHFCVQCHTCRRGAHSHSVLTSNTVLLASQVNSSSSLKRMYRGSSIRSNKPCKHNSPCPAGATCPPNYYTLPNPLTIPMRPCLRLCIRLQPSVSHQLPPMVPMTTRAVGIQLGLS